ncbi:copper resistance system multicopper oxidase [Micavibrio aeruginosavorus]|uniref:Copper resistance protein A n=1 Tax=Micavibrio aeruginosavorus (strain ARL-13) TaxID=856793 RepID=G2KRL4_MICAA|nr:copper resistance system multicopper oxidase [Micavibrio aeruginosavorus]AEP09576.1 copper resistance protein A [Micavibrio aeruginosavorus ARL-13]
MKFYAYTLFLCLFFSFASPAKAEEYNLVIAHEPVNITGKTVEKITINGTIPGPTLRFTEGEDAIIHVTNKMDEDTSVHWHGLILPGEMDGVPGFNGFPGIKPGETFTYRFPVNQTGTYWYHAHSSEQEQDGHYGSLVLVPKGKDPIRADRDYVVLLSDFHDEDGKDIFSNLKMSSEYYQYARRTIGDFFADAEEKGFGKAWANAKMWGEMRMLPTDLSDVSGYTFLVNGRTPEQNWTALFKPGERVRLRFINASAMSIYDVRIPGLKMSVVEADGQGVEPVTVDEFRFGVAETYDVIVTPKEDKAFTIAAESIDRTGFALGTLAPREGMKGPAPQTRPRALLTMADMGMGHDMAGMEGMDHSKMNHDMPMGDMAGMDHGNMGHDMVGMSMEDMQSGWAQAGTPPGDKALSYADLRYVGIQADTRQPEREILVRLGGNMERFIWTINDKKFEDSGPINLKYGERVRLKFVNDTMMAHPMHLHGMFVQLENGQPAEKLPNKHTVIVAPGQTYSVLLTADQPGEWAFHCHLLFHMSAGMMNKVVVAKLDPNAVPPPKASTTKAAPQKEKPEQADPHEGHSMPMNHQGMDMKGMDDMPSMDHSTPQKNDTSSNQNSSHGGHDAH